MLSAISVLHCIVFYNVRHNVKCKTWQDSVPVRHCMGAVVSCARQLSPPKHSSVTKIYAAGALNPLTTQNIYNSFWDISKTLATYIQISLDHDQNKIQDKVWHSSACLGEACIARRKRWSTIKSHDPVLGGFQDQGWSGIWGGASYNAP